ncbi:MAG: GLPGLI family protein [Pedobacter sp.]|nr:GLPGLI family protein [Pedobacter sp.]
MKTILTTLCAITVTSMMAVAQSPDKALARVRYSFTHIRDTTAKDKPYTENMLLVIGKNASVYTSYDKINRDLEMQKQLQEQIKNQAGSGQMSVKLNRTSTKPVSDIDYFYFGKENKFVTKERLFNNYLVEEAAPKISWKLSKDTASFSGVKCKKATAHFKGRNWIAWYAEDLPFQSGPWKLNGLPGLIIEAYDEKKEVQFQFAGIDNVKEEEAKKEDPNQPTFQTPSGTGVVKIMGMDIGSAYLGSEIKLPTDAVKTSQKELDKLKDARDKDPQGFMNAQMAASGVQFGVNQRAQFRTTPGPRPINVINNPIELPETK